MIALLEKSAFSWQVWEKLKFAFDFVLVFQNTCTKSHTNSKKLFSLSILAQHLNIFIEDDAFFTQTK